MEEETIELVVEGDVKAMLEALARLETYEERTPIYNIVGSEGDFNTRQSVNRALEEFKKLVEA